MGKSSFSNITVSQHLLLRRGRFLHLFIRWYQTSLLRLVHSFVRCFVFSFVRAIFFPPLQSIRIKKAAFTGCEKLMPTAPLEKSFSILGAFQQEGFDLG